MPHDDTRPTKGDGVVKLMRSLGAEDVALLLGTLLLGIGTGIAFGYPFGLIVVGALSTAYGVWITERRT